MQNLPHPHCDTSYSQEISTPLHLTGKASEKIWTEWWAVIYLEHLGGRASESEEKERDGDRKSAVVF